MHETQNGVEYAIFTVKQWLLVLYGYPTLDVQITR